MIRFVSQGGSGFGTKLLDAETGEDLTSIVPILYGAQITLGDVVTANVTLAMIEADVVANKTSFLTMHPISKDLQPVAAIEFRDGWRVEISEDGTPRVRQKNPTR
jgi:hypothetical protein